MTAKRNHDPLEGLSDFQRATATHAFRRLYLDEDSTQRFLVADETGLGKTHVAKGVIGLAIEHLQNVAEAKRIDIVYVCSNLDIAAQNISKLNPTGASGGTFASRLGLLITQPEMLRPVQRPGEKPMTFVAFTPATSFQLSQQMGQAPERAILYVLLRDHLDLRGAQVTAAQRIFQGAVRERRTFSDSYVTQIEAKRPFEPGIERGFLRAFDRSRLRHDFAVLLAGVAGRAALSAEQKEAARHLIAGLRQMLALAAVRALEPDLVILDEFQRFPKLLDTNVENDATDLAQYFFNQPHARVLLLSATPYKAFTYAEEANGGNHYEDFIKTLGFLARSDEPLLPVREDLAALRRAALADEPVLEIRNRLQSRLRNMMARTERPPATTRDVTPDAHEAVLQVRAAELTDYVALRRVATAVKAPLTVEYWKSAPYFFNFLDGYRLGDRLKEEVKKPSRWDELAPMVDSAQRIQRGRVEQFDPIEWGNARLRALAEDTIDRGWWRLLWVPPSLTYYALAGPYTDAGTAMTKRLIFSSWVAAPSAIASLLSYEAERRIALGVGARENTPEARAAISSRLDYRVAAGRPAAMSTLALFWPQPALASATDPLDAARSVAGQLDAEQVLEWAVQRVVTLVGPTGTSRAPASTAWHWAASVIADRGSAVGTALLTEDTTSLVAALRGGDPSEDEAEPSSALHAHVTNLLATLEATAPDVDRPVDLHEGVALLGLGAPGNIAWRALNRIRAAHSAVTDIGVWRAAAILSSGLRSLFARPSAMLLLDGLYALDSAGRSDDAYWRVVARYCIDGGLQAVLDEYLHHLAGEAGIDTTTDAGLGALAITARRALVLRESVYRAADTEDFGGDGIGFPSRFALRFGNTRQAQDDARLPEVRAAFNSPFWPFVLATTSVGQEGVDFHWWCHSIVHWNLPANPVDFEQREGRVNRYKGHAIRKNVASAHRDAAFAAGVIDPWSAAFAAATAERDEQLGDLKPGWVYDGPARVERSILSFPLSRDEDRWRRLQESLALYRLAFGQPRQEDLIAALERHGVANDPARLAELRIDLRPPRTEPRTEPPQG